MQQPPNPYTQYPQQQWQQPPMPQQKPFTGYPQWTEVPPPPPPTKSRKTLWIVLGVIVGVVLFSCIGLSALASLTAQQQTNTQQTAVTQAVQQPTQHAATSTSIPETPTPTHVPKWVTTQTFTGNGNKKTGFFTVPDNWKLVWNCDDRQDQSNIGGVLYVSVTYADGSTYDPFAVSGTCKAGVITTDSTEEHLAGGQVYLEVTAGLSWTIEVQVLK